MRAHQYAYDDLWYDDEGYWGDRRIAGTDPHAALAPLIDRLRRYDDRRVQLEERGGTVADLQAITALLQEQFSLQTRWGERTVSLADQKELHGALLDCMTYGAHLQVRRLYTKVPAYYLCRTRRQWLGEYSLIVQDLYRSPGYEFADERFAGIMVGGHEQFYLRLSPFRVDVDQGLAAPGGIFRGHSTDAVLCHVGRHVLQSAWHEDQRPGMLTAKLFGFDAFRQAVELLYFVLSGELCEVRHSIDETMLEFFRTVYRQPAMQAFLRRLRGLDGAMLNEYPTQALSDYARLARAFRAFIRTAVPWGARGQAVELYKLIYGNFSRLDAVGERLRGAEALREPGEKLERTAERIIAGFAR